MDTQDGVGQQVEEGIREALDEMLANIDIGALLDELGISTEDILRMVGDALVDVIREFLDELLESLPFLLGSLG